MIHCNKHSVSISLFIKSNLDTPRNIVHSFPSVYFMLISGISWSTCTLKAYYEPVWLNINTV